MDLYDVLPADRWLSADELRELVRRRSKAGPLDYAMVDAEYSMTLMSGVVVGRVDEAGAWSYRRAAQRPGPPDPRTNLPGGANYKRGLQREHEANMRRLDEENARAAEARQRAWQTDPQRLQIRAIVDERLH